MATKNIVEKFIQNGVELEVPTKTSDLTNDSGFITSSYHDNTKQDTLVSGTNIKTVNGNSVLGSGNLTISGGISNDTTGTTTTVTKIRAGTETEYSNLSSKNATTIYYVF